MVDSDEDLVLLDRWRTGDKVAGNALFERHFQALYRFFRNKTDDAIEDLVQETFLACVASKEAFRADASFRTYLFVIARNVLYAYWKRRAKLGEQIEIGEQSIENLSTSPSGVIARAAEHRLLARALRAIPLELQVILELHFWEGLSGPELAHILDIPEGTVRSRLRRAREQLEAKLAELAGDQTLLASTRSALDSWVRSLANA
ncbi:MAG: RNA polymerase sigma factor [Kofleriaceae bacterium]